MSANAKSDIGVIDHYLRIIFCTAVWHSVAQWSEEASTIISVDGNPVLVNNSVQDYQEDLRRKDLHKFLRLRIERRVSDQTCTLGLVP
jgi:hypothetical protein